MASNKPMYHNGTIDIEQVATRIHERMEASARIAKPRIESKDVTYLLQVIDRINQEPEYSYGIDGYLFEQIKIPTCFSSFVWPEKICFVGGVMYPDLRNTRKCSGEKVELSKLKDIADKLAGTFKSQSEVVSIDTLRTTKLLDDVNFSVFYDDSDFVRPSNGDDVFIPIPVKDFVVELYGRNLITQSAEFVFQRAIDNMCFSTRSTASFGKSEEKA